MKVTNEAVKFFNYSAGIVKKNKDSNIVCVVIRTLDDGTHKFYIDGQYPEDFDIDWYSITQPGWDFSVLFFEDAIFNATIDYDRSSSDESNRLKVIV